MTRGVRILATVTVGYLLVRASVQAAGWAVATFVLVTITFASLSLWDAFRGGPDRTVTEPRSHVRRVLPCEWCRTVRPLVAYTSVPGDDVELVCSSCIAGDLGVQFPGDAA